MYVVNCDYLLLGFTVAPGNDDNNNWVLEVDRRYEITVRVYDKGNHEMIIGEVCCHGYHSHTLIIQLQHMLLNTVIPSSHFMIHFSSSNQSYHYVTATTQGVVMATSTLKKIKVMII